MNENDRFTPNESLQGDALLAQLIEAYKTANWGTAITPQTEQNTAREFIRRFGHRAVETAIRWLNECRPDSPADSFHFGKYSNADVISSKTGGDHHDYEFLILLLTKIGDERAVEPLLHHFRAHEEYGSGTARQIAKFFSRVKSRGAAKGLVLYLDTSSNSMRGAASYGLGLLAVDETRDALRSALDHYGRCVKEGLEQANTDFAKSVAYEWDIKRRAAGPPIGSMTDSQMVDILKALCRAYDTSNTSEIRRLELLAIDIGEELNRRGGEKEMLRIFNSLGAIPGSRTLEMRWHGIGGWLG